LAWNKKTIVVDPVEEGAYDDLPKPDLILITDVHHDHMSPSTVAKLSAASTRVVAPAAVAASIPGSVVLKNGERQEVSGIPVEAIPMYNLVRGPSAGQLYHDKGRGNGYVLTLADKRVYVAGDTECTPEMKALAGIDVAFVPMNLPYTMPPAEAAECVRAFRPKIVYPYHYRGSDTAQFAAALAGETDVEVRQRSWY
jgi:L-ascorbate metabolism protein UlaG (beta-lactamase superfamily)